MNVLGISSNTYNILATLFKHIFDSGSVAGGPGGGGAWLPLLLRPVGKLSMLSENCQCCQKLSKLSTGGGGGGG